MTTGVSFHAIANHSCNGSIIYLTTAASYSTTILILHHAVIRLHLSVRRLGIRRLTTCVNSVPVPIEAGVGVGISLTTEQVTEHSAQIGDVGFGLKFEAATVGQILRKLAGASLTKGRNGYALLLLHNELVLFGRALRLEPLPGKAALQKVNEDVADGLEVITTTLLYSQVIVDRGVTRSSGERSSLALRNVLKGSRMTIPLTQPKINTVDVVSTSSAGIRHKVRRLDIPMNQMTGMHQLNTLQHLIRNQQDRLETETPSTFIELILQTRSEQIHDHQVVAILRSKVVHLGKARSILELTIDLVFVTQLWAASSMLLELYSNLLTICAHS